jgi:hypothetical protein
VTESSASNVTTASELAARREAKTLAKLVRSTIVGQACARPETHCRECGQPLIRHGRPAC